MIIILTVLLVSIVLVLSILNSIKCNNEKFKQNKNIYFLGNKKWGSFKLRAFQIGEQIKKEFNNNINIKYYDINEQNKLKNIKDIIFCIKCIPHNKNNCIIDIVDEYKLLNKDLSFAKYIIYPNKKCLVDNNNYLNKGISIQHHWDTSIKFIKNNNNNNNIKCCYYGNISNGNLPNFIKNLSFIDIIDSDKDKKSKLYNYNVHLNIRDSNSIAFKYKPITKIAFAACFDSVIITLKEPSIKEFECMNEYPYYMNEYSLKEFLRVYNIVNQTFNKDLWFKAKQCLKNLRNETSIDVIIKQYLKII